MYSREQLNKMYELLGKTIDISDELFDDARREYQNLGRWLDSHTPLYNISVYPQGSFALGTVVKPISEKDDYDLDLVCEFEERYGLTAKQLKVDVVKPLLTGYRRITGDILNKRRCWHIEYEEIPNFHMDVVPAINEWFHIEITDHNEASDTYQYIGSNPAGYVDWFFERCKKMTDSMYNAYVQNKSVAQADIEQIRRYKIKTPLQRAVQILKRHRDIMFDRMPNQLKPISIIITTIAGQLYENQTDIFDALTAILGNAENYIMRNKKDGQFFIENPSFPGENFADKWNIHSERADSFLMWVRQAKEDLISSDLTYMLRSDMSKHIQKVFGVTAGTKLFAEMAKAENEAIKNNAIKIDTSTGSLSHAGTVSIPPNHHHGC